MQYMTSLWCYVRHASWQATDHMPGWTKGCQSMASHRLSLAACGSPLASSDRCSWQLHLPCCSLLEDTCLHGTQAQPPTLAMRALVHQGTCIQHLKLIVALSAALQLLHTDLSIHLAQPWIAQNGNCCGRQRTCECQEQTILCDMLLQSLHFARQLTQGCWSKLCSWRYMIPSCAWRP